MCSVIDVKGICARMIRELTGKRIGEKEYSYISLSDIVEKLNEVIEKVNDIDEYIKTERYRK